MILNQYFTSLQSFLKLTPQTGSDYQNRQAFYKKLRAYYLSNGLYDSQTSQDYYLGYWDESMKSLRTCGNRVVEFYVAKLEPGAVPDALPILAANEAIVAPIQRVWAWSNLAQRKPAIIRGYALSGDVFIKVSANATGDQVHQQFFDPQYVVDFREDELGMISYIRLDVPAGKMTHTEIWTMAGYQTFSHRYGLGADARFLGDPTTEGTLEDLGIDFIPFTHARFRDIGEDWGLGCFVHALDKIDEANRMSSRLHQMLFRYNKALWVAAANATDNAGRPIPAPKIGDSTGNMDVKDDAIISMPGVSSLTALVPDIRYGDALAILQDQMKEIERDLPELAYYDLKGLNLSGKAVRELMGDAIDKVIEARGNFEVALARADVMALKIGAAIGIFAGLGDDYDHTFRVRDVIPIDEAERATTLRELQTAGLPLPVAMRVAGYSEDLIEQAGTGTTATSAAKRQPVELPY